MSLCPSNGKGVAFRAAIAAGSLAAFLFALVLSSAPQLHEQLHGATGVGGHECAVTLLASGSYQHTPVSTISLAPPPTPKSFVQALASFELVCAHLEFSLLEHAPPANS
jgi:predicted metal-binding membrane protein